MKPKFFFWLLIVFVLIPGSFRNAKAASGITADVSSLHFGDQADGTLSPPQEVNLTNASNGDGIINSVLIAGEDPLQFVLFEDFCSGEVLADQESCTLSVGFAPSVEAPQDEGLAQADLIINFQDPPSLSIPLTGNILVPNIESSLSSLNFGSEVVGRQSDFQTVVISNTGEAELLIGATGSSRGDTVDFGPTLDLCTFQILAPGENCNLELIMRPTQVGDRFAQYTIESSDPDQPLLAIDLSGTGTGSGGICSLNKRNTGFAGWEFWLMLTGFPLLGLFLRKQLTGSSKKTLLSSGVSKG